MRLYTRRTRPKQLYGPSEPKASRVVNRAPHLQLGNSHGLLTTALGLTRAISCSARC
jgi:hypothetical protein